MLISRIGGFEFCDEIYGNFIEWSVWNFSHLKWVGLDFGFSSVAEGAVGNVLPYVLNHTLPVILAFYKTVGVSVSLVS